MKDLTFIDLLNRIAKEGSAVKVLQEITREYAEGVEEPKEYQWVRDAYNTISTGHRSAVAWFLRDKLGVPLTPPSPKRPGVGVVMVGESRGSYLILDVKNEGIVYRYWSNEGIGWNIPHKGDRPATDEEITELVGGLAIDKEVEETMKLFTWDKCPQAISTSQYHNWDFSVTPITCTDCGAVK